jgi:hypothetical protein
VWAPPEDRSFVPLLYSRGRDFRGCSPASYSGIILDREGQTPCLGRMDYSLGSPNRPLFYRIHAQLGFAPVGSIVPVSRL